MKYFLPLLISAAALALPLCSEAAQPVISSSSYSTFSSSAASGRASLLYTDGTGRLTEFSADTEQKVLTVTIRQDGAVMWRRSFPAGQEGFSVSRIESNGEVYFLMHVGGRAYKAAPDSKGEWDVRPAGREKQAVPLAR